MAPTISTMASGSIPEPRASPEPMTVDDASDALQEEKEEDKDDHIASNKDENPSAECNNSDDAASVNTEELEDAQNQGGEGGNQPTEANTAENGTLTDNDEPESTNAEVEGDLISNNPPANESADFQPPAELETKITGDGELTSNALPNKSANVNLIPPAWADVRFVQLVDYPKSSLRAQSYFDLQQIRATKPLTLIAMGIGVPNFPDFENDAVIKLCLRKSKYQLYYSAEVLPTKKNKAYLQKEIMRRCILFNLREMGEDATYNYIFKGKLRPRLPVPGSYSLNKCIETLKNWPLPAEEYQFVIESARQWRQQVRDQLGKVEDKTKELMAALAEFDELRAKEFAEFNALQAREQAKFDKLQANEIAKATKMDAATAHAMATTNTNDHLQAVHERYAKHISDASIANPINQHNALMMPPNAMPYHSPVGHGIHHHIHQQIAAPADINMVQAHMISQYWNQPGRMQNQAATASSRTQFEIAVSKDTFKFNAAKFVAYPGFRERLHGHNYRVKVRVMGSHTIGRDGYVLDFGCVKSVTEEVCNAMNEYFLVPTLSEVLKITVEEDEEEEPAVDDKPLPSERNNDAAKTPTMKKTKKQRQKRSQFPGSVKIVTEDGAMFVIPKQDCLLLPIVHTTPEELGVYLYGQILQKLDSGYLRKRGVMAMEVTVSEEAGQDAVFRCAIPESGGKEIDVSSFIAKDDKPVMPCATETKAAKLCDQSKKKRRPAGYRTKARARKKVKRDQVTQGEEVEQRASNAAQKKAKRNGATPEKGKEQQTRDAARMQKKRDEATLIEGPGAARVQKKCDETSLEESAEQQARDAAREQKEQAERDEATPKESEEQLASDAAPMQKKHDDSSLEEIAEQHARDSARKQKEHTKQDEATPEDSEEQRARDAARMQKKHDETSLVESAEQQARDAAQKQKESDTATPEESAA